MPHIPPITKALLLICTAVFCLSLLAPLSLWFALWPLGSGQFMPWQPFTFAFLHADMLALFFNALALWMFGGELEMFWGQRRYLQYLAACLLATALATIFLGLVVPYVGPVRGMSGALFGLLFASARHFPDRVIMPLFPPIPMKQKHFVMLFGGLELLMGLFSGDGLAHFAVLAGMGGGWLMFKYWRSQSRRR
ncbi:rhomboid family intramembrane serine protease [Ideonella livida]|uniref:Rhomboid family intramembrane serine protease n=1 Tax=Ideonella livida TaxID=2707176 RepID=A0A7C9TKD3_9BURK|nr:rhomboid family intramembrane serine protease [Ideonella livida]NDY91664.1 rhomboid family intramembrane serine protease [Ideonella livida]